MNLKSGTIIPFQFKNTRKLISIFTSNDSEKLTLNDVKNKVRSAFRISKPYKFYNRKIGFHIPDEMLIPYLEQRHDLTNFVIKIIECNSDENSSEFTEQKNVNKRPGCSVSAYPTKRFKSVEDSLDDHLDDILKESEIGKKICNNFENSNKLNEEDRLALINLIITHEFESILLATEPITLESQRLNDLALAIVRRFPCEHVPYYYVAHPNALKYIAGGGLYDEFLAKKIYHMETERSYCFDSSEEIIEADFPELQDLQKISDCWEPYFDVWRKTFQLRMAYISNIIDPLPYFEKHIGQIHDKSIELVEHDFKMLFPDKSNMLFDNWDQLIERIFTEALVLCRNDVPLIMDLYGNMPDLSGLMMLSYFLENYESNVTPFKKDDPKNLIVHIESIDGDPETFLKDFCRIKKLSTPMVFVTGKIPDEFIFYVLVGEKLFRIETALKAIDFCFKCYRVLYLYYPSKQLLALTVIQKAFYEIETDQDGIKYENFLKIFNL